MELIAIVKPTHDCNLRCEYCYIEKGEGNGRMFQESQKKYSKKHGTYL